MSGKFDLIYLVYGVFSVSSVMYINYKLKMHRFFDDDMDDLSQVRFGVSFLYVFWMIYQIVLAGFHVLTVIIRPKMPIETAMLSFKADLPSAHAKMVLGNSITLTPGTLTVDIEGDTFTVHALDKDSYQGIVTDEMPRKVLQLFSKEDRKVIHDIKITTSNNS